MPLVIKKLIGIFADMAEEFPKMKLAYLFGSRLDENLGPLSDYDFAVLFSRESSAQELVSHLTHALSQKLTDRVDVVGLHDAPVELAYAVISSGVLLHESDVRSRVEYEARVMGLYLDYLPVLRANRKDILKGDYHEVRVQRYRKTLRRTQRTLGQIGAFHGQASNRV